MSVLLKPIRVDTSRRVHNDGFLAERLIYVSNWVVFGLCPFTLAQIEESVTDFGNTVSNYKFCNNLFKAIIIL